MELKQAKGFLNKNDVGWRSEENYLDDRIEIEKWIKTHFINNGGIPKRENPLIMSLGVEMEYEKVPEYKNKLIIPLSIFSRSQITFTFLDSMVMVKKYGKKHNPYMLDEINTMINNHGVGYIEAQIWDDEPLNEIIIDYRNTGKLNFL